MASHLKDAASPQQPDATDLARTFDLFDPALQQDPFPAMASMRTECPVTWSEQHGGYWVMTEYDDIRRVLSDAEAFSNRQITIHPHNDPEGPLIPTQLDPPEVIGYRQVLGPMFSPRAVAHHEQRTREIARELIEPFAANGGGDFVSDFTIPLPSKIFLLMLGLPLTDMDRLNELKETILHTAFNLDDPDDVARGFAARRALFDYFRETIAVRRSGQVENDGLVAQIINARFKDGREWSESEILRTLHNLLTAGLDTVTSTLGLSFHFLATHPEHRRQLREEPELVPGAVLELIRYSGAIVSMGRTCIRDTEIGGKLVKAGDFVLPPTSAANRDPKEFPDPDRVDFRRNAKRHLSFGVGLHRCLGAPLAELQMRIALEEVHRAMPDYWVDETQPPVNHFFGVLMGIDRLPLLCR